MKTQKFDIQTSDGACDCFAAYPDQSGPFPGVMLYMDAYGPRQYLYEMTQDLAAQGYYVLLPNLLYRVRRAPLLDVHYPLSAEQMPVIRPQLLALLSAFEPEASVRDGEFFLNFLSQQKQVRPEGFAITGYCMGGSLALRMAARYPKQVTQVASFHAGRLATDAPDSPHLLAPQIKAQVYIAHADNDESMLAPAIARLQTAFTSAGVRFESELYKGAAHGFTMKDLPVYNAEALTRHWHKLLAMLTQSPQPT